MITYFKYSTGPGFTLDGEEYKGMFNVRDSVAYTGKVFSARSRPLTPTKTFISEVFTNTLNFNGNFSTPLFIDPKTKLYPRSIFTSTEFLKLLVQINSNNIKLFSKMVTLNPRMMSIFEKNITNVPISYCLTASDDSFTGKKLPLIRLSDSKEESIAEILSKRTAITPYNSLFITLSNSDRFHYFSRGTLIRGSYGITNLPLTTLDGVWDEFTSIYYNEPYNDIYIAGISKYLKGFYTPEVDCDVITPIDNIDISTTNITNGYAAFGRKYRTCIVLGGIGKQAIEIADVKGEIFYNIVDVGNLGFDSVISTCQRFEDDALGIFGIKDGLFYLKVIDLEKIVQYLSDLNNAQDNFDSTKGEKIYLIHSSEILNIDTRAFISFCPFDSDLIVFKSYGIGKILTRYEFRSISSPLYPIVNLIRPESTTIFNGFIPYLNNIPLAFNTINLSFNSGLSGLSHSIYDIQFHVSDALRCFVAYYNSFDIFECNPYFSLVPLDLQKDYSPKEITCKSSIGIAFNTIIKSIVYDTFSLLKLRSGVFTYDSITKEVQNIIHQLQGRVEDKFFNLYLNEGVNSGVLSRVIQGIIQIQRYISGSNISSQ